MIYDDIDNHIGEAGSIEKAAIPLGMYLAWCVNLQLVGERLHVEAEKALLRVRYREMRGSELLVSACGGTLKSEDLNEAGRVFTDRYYASFLDDFRQAFDGVSPYEVKDDWHHYDAIAAVLTAEYMNGGRKGSWWKFWK